MNSDEFIENICRVCLDENVVIEWNEQLSDRTTYKDCYYKYTHLERYVSDSFSPMLCEMCANGLKNLHTLILKALESHKFFQEANLFDTELNEISNVVKGTKYPTIDFETVIVEKVKPESSSEVYFVYDDSEDEELPDTELSEIKGCGHSKRTTTAMATSKTQENCEEEVSHNGSEDLDIAESISVSASSNLNASSRRKPAAKSKSNKELSAVKLVKNSDNKGSYLTIPLSNSNTRPRRKITLKRKFKQVEVESDLINNQTKSEDENICDRTEEEQVKPKVKGNYIGPRNCSICSKTLQSRYALERHEKRHTEKGENKDNYNLKSRNSPRICSICSKIVHSKYALQKHEKTHIYNRERKETCNICGLKFYNKSNLYGHKLIHNENRNKNHKCDFCDKAFYNSGARNVHRRIHLGQMIPCTLCSKEFFRQVDLERHMNSHSAVCINTTRKQRSRYYVRCKYCDKIMLSTSFKSHTAAHLNTPLMKCSICDKEFFNRTRCVFHVRKNHNKSNEEYNNFITLYSNSRISRLFLEQTADVQIPDSE